jgi:CspA family cold shock protein
MSTEQEIQTASDRLTGRVKWFNSKAGYGFLTVFGGEHADKDIFVHYSSIRVKNSQYKYLVQGEYVEFTLVKSDNEKHEYHAADVYGIQGGMIMCETQRQQASTKPRYSYSQRTGRKPSYPQTQAPEGEYVKAVKNTRRGPAPVHDEARDTQPSEEGGEFIKVAKRPRRAPTSGTTTRPRKA